MDNDPRKINEVVAHPSDVVPIFIAAHGFSVFDNFQATDRGIENLKALNEGRGIFEDETSVFKKHIAMIGDDVKLFPYQEEMLKKCMEHKNASFLSAYGGGPNPQAITRESIEVAREKMSTSEFHALMYGEFSDPDLGKSHCDVPVIINQQES